MGKIAAIKLKPRCFVATKNNKLGAQISTSILEGQVNVNARDEVPTKFTAQTMSPEAVPGLSWIAPFLFVEWWDPDLGLQQVREQQGLYQVMPPGETHTEVNGIGRIEAFDPCWLLKYSTKDGGTTIAAGANVVDSIKSILIAAGLTRSNIPSSTKTMPKKKWYDAGTSRLEIINELLMQIGYYPLWCDRKGVPTSRKIGTLRKNEPVRKIRSEDGHVVNTINIDPDRDRLCNRVTVIKTDPSDPISYTKTNTREDSPISTVNLDGQIMGKKIEASNIDSLDEAKALANKTLEEGASMYHRISLETVPIFLDWDVRDIIQLYIFRDDGYSVARGLWVTDQLQVGFTPKQGAQKWQLNRLMTFDPEDD